MFSPYYLQTGQNTWLWYVILAVLLLVLIIWWFNRRRGGQVESAPVTSVRAGGEVSADDLTKIEGIGPKVAKVLNDAGIRTFEGLAQANPEDVQRVLDEAGLQMMSPEGWIEQARLAAKGDWEAFKRLQDELEGGRKK